MERLEPNRWTDKSIDIGRRALSNFGKTYHSTLERKPIMEKNPLPEKLITWADLARGIGEVAVGEIAKAYHFLFDHLRNETPSEHFRGGAAELDRKLYDTTNIQNRWDSLGDYHRGE